MKKLLVFCSVLLISAVVARGDELLFESFDNIPAGTSVSDVGMWSCLAGDTSGVVSDDQSFSPANSAELPIPAAGKQSSIVISNSETYVWAKTEHNIMRFAARVYLERTDQTVTWFAGPPSGDKWVVKFDGTDGHIKIDGIDTGVTAVTGRFAQVVLYYDMSGVRVTLHYDGRQIAQRSVLPTKKYELNHIGFRRKTAGTGRVFIDDISVTTFPVSTVCWWRFEEGCGLYYEEYTSQFMPARNISLFDGRYWAESSLKKVGIQDNSYHNRFVYVGPILSATNKTDISLSDWTVEGIVKIKPGSANVELFNIGGKENHQSEIDVAWVAAYKSVAVYLRDNNRTSQWEGDYYISTQFCLPDDGKMHHFAVTMSGLTLLGFIDYVQVYSNNTGTASSGLYEFDNTDKAFIGIANNNANASTKSTIFDEIRISQVALSPADFLKPVRQKPVCDFDGDGKADVGIFRASNQFWVNKNSRTGSALKRKWGIQGDVPAVGDYDGDGISDTCIFRSSSGRWVSRLSSDQSIKRNKWGIPGDIPVQADFDGDYITDLAIFRPSTRFWVIKNSADGTITKRKWGIPGDIPVPGDYNNDGMADIAIFRPSTGWWIILMSGNGQIVRTKWGVPGDVAIPADYDGDGQTDLAIFRPSTRFWVIKNSSDNTITKQKWGVSGDIPIPADYDGDGKSDIGIFRPTTGFWVIRNSGGVVSRQKWGISGDEPLLPQYWIYTLMP